MKVSKDNFMNMLGKFTWDFGQCFFIETEVGNFVWSDPDYNGDNSIKPFRGTVQDYFGKGYGRCKGEHIVSCYCGEDFIFEVY